MSFDDPNCELSRRLNMAKSRVLAMADSLERNGWEKPALAMRECRNRVDTETREGLDGKPVTRPIRLHGCKCRMCPACDGQNLRSRAATWIGMLDELQYRHPDTQYAYCTFTMPTRPLEEVAQAISDLQAAWAWFKRSGWLRACWAGIMRSVEFTVTATGDIHVHIHTVCQVAGDGFDPTSPRYLDYSKVRNRWREAIGYDGEPHVDIKPIRNFGNGPSLTPAVCYIIKYAVKPSTIIKPAGNGTWRADDEIVRHVYPALKGRRRFSLSGTFKTLAAEIKADDAALTHREDRPYTPFSELPLLDTHSRIWTGSGYDIRPYRGEPA